MTQGELPEDWQNAYMVALYKGMRGKCECLNYKGFVIPGALYDRVVIQRKVAGTKHQTEEEYFSFGRGIS